MRIFGLIFGLLVGGWLITCSIGNFEWFFRLTKAHIITRLFGRNGARIFYMLLGLFFVAGGIFLAVVPENIH